MTDIPDDVVERALAKAEAVLNDWALAKYSIGYRRAVTAAGRVFVEWEREQCARRLEEWAVVSFPVEEPEARDLIAAIRARSGKE
jgi:hypothetical protein